MKKISSFMMVLCCNVVFAAPQGAVITYAFEGGSEAEAISGTMTTYLQNEKSRIEMNMENMPMGGDLVHLTDAKSEQYHILFPAQKRYMKGNFKTKTQASDATSFSGFEKTGSTKTIAGYACEVYRRSKGKNVEEVCLNQSLYNEFKNLAVSMQRNLMQKKNQNAYPGMPLEFVSKRKNKLQYKFYVTSLKRQNIASSQFAVPSDYEAGGMAMMMSEAMKGSANEKESSDNPETEKQMDLMKSKLNKLFGKKKK